MRICLGVLVVCFALAAAAPARENDLLGKLTELLKRTEQEESKPATDGASTSTSDEDTTGEKIAEEAEDDDEKEEIKEDEKIVDILGCQVDVAMRHNKKDYYKDLFKAQKDLLEEIKKAVASGESLKKIEGEAETLKEEAEKTTNKRDLEKLAENKPLIKKIVCTSVKLSIAMLREINNGPDKNTLKNVHNCQKTCKLLYSEKQVDKATVVAAIKSDSDCLTKIKLEEALATAKKAVAVDSEEAEPYSKYLAATSIKFFKLMATGKQLGSCVSAFMEMKEPEQEQTQERALRALIQAYLSKHTA